MQIFMPKVRAARLFFIVVGAQFLLSACGIQRGVPRDSSSLPPGYGAVATQVTFEATNGFIGVPKITAISDSSLTVPEFILELDHYHNHLVAVLREGDYSWRGIYFGLLNSEFRHLMPFHVTAGKVNYIGDLILVIDGRSGKYQLRIADEMGSMKLYMNEHYPVLSRSYPMVSNLTQDRR